MLRLRRAAVLLPLVLAPVLLASCGGFKNPAGLTRRGATVDVLSSCSDRGITELKVIEAFVPDVREPGEIATTTTEDPDAEPVVLYAMVAPVDSLGVSTLTVGEPPAEWITTGSTNAFGLRDRIIIEVEYGDADGDATRLRLEQIAVGAVWVDDENIEPDVFADQIRECDPAIRIEGRPKTLLTLLGVVGGLAVIAAPLVFLWSLVRD